MNWHEIPEPLGRALWAVLRDDMGRREGRTIGVHESFSAPRGDHGIPTMLTVVGHFGGPVMKLETTWDHGRPEDRATRFWLPIYPEEAP